VPRIRLTRKLAQVLNGVDVSRIGIGDSLDVSPAEAQLLIAEGWAEPVDTADDRPSQADDTEAEGV
jgi:hypothetical protein